MSRFRIGVDIGGTFTDIVIFDKSKGDIHKVLKVSTNPKKPEVSVIEGIKKVLQPHMEFDFVSHATTIATNSLLGQIGLELPKTALITTKGFRDLIEIGRQKRPTLYDFFFEKPKPLIPRELRFEVEERTNSEGKELKPVNKQDLERIVEKLIEKGVKSVAVSFLHSYVNPSHEEEVEAILKKRLPNLFISLSSKVDAEHREYERTSTTVINAVLKPIVSNYVSKLTREVEKIVGSPLYIMQSNGGLASSIEVVEKPISIIESGPAAGIMAVKYLAEVIGEKNALGFDMGGTTAKAGTIINYEPTVTTEYEVGGKVHMGRIVKGSGYPVRFPFIDLSEISAGGGTIIWVDEAGALKVGPISAGADPGPACYGKGGEYPTLTDAHLVLGRIDPENFLGGTMKVYVNESISAFKDKVTDYTGLEPIEAAIGAVKIANNLMSRLIKITTIEKGVDPRDLTFFSYGGAGSLHAISLSFENGFKKIVVPKYPGLFSAMGLLSIDFTYTFLKSVRKKVSEVEVDYLRSLYSELVSTGLSKLSTLGLSKADIFFSLILDLRYYGQGYELLVKFEPSELNHESIVAKFHSEHKRVYGYSIEDEEVEIVNMRVIAKGLIGKIKYRRKEIKENFEPTPKGRREVYFENIDDFAETSIFYRENLRPGAILRGPSIVEQYDTVIPIPPGFVAFVDEFENIVIERE